MRTIDGDRLKKNIKNHCAMPAWCVVLVWNEIDEQPTIEAEPVVHGRWIGIQYDGYADGCPVYDIWECSECHEEYENEGDPPYFNYCPNCGAKMDGGDQNV